MISWRWLWKPLRFSAAVLSHGIRCRNGSFVCAEVQSVHVFLPEQVFFVFWRSWDAVWNWSVATLCSLELEVFGTG